METPQLTTLFELFVKERRYLKGVSETTLKSYRYALKRYQDALEGSPHAPEDLPTKPSLSAFVVHMRGYLSVTTCNISIRSFNSFLSWLAENEYMSSQLRTKQLREPKKAPQGLSDDDLHRLTTWKPKTFGEQRLHALLCLLVDSGMRIQEALELEKDDIDFENLLITVRHGKGDKERVVPMSFDLRKIIYRFVGKHSLPYVFTTRSGSRLSYHNARKDFHVLCNKVGVKPCGFHDFRRSFALNFVREGGNIFILQRILGHTSLDLTRRYVQLQTEDLKEAHIKTSVLKKMMLRR